MTYGVYAYIQSTEIIKKFSPFRAYLESALAQKGFSIDIRLKISPTYEGAINDLAAGRSDFVRFGPVSYVLAKAKNKNIQLLAMESNGGKKFFNGVISVAADSPIKTLADLEGKHIAFGSRRSTTGRYLSQAALFEAGLTIDDLAGYKYLGRHDKVAFAVAAKQYDAGASNENTFNKFAKQRGLRKLAEFPCVTKPWVSREGLDPKLHRALKEALLELKDPQVLKTIKRTGLMPASDSDYDSIRDAMMQARKFDRRTLNFGIYASQKPSVLYNKLRPMLDAVERRLAIEGWHLDFEIKVFQDYADAVEALVAGNLDAARLGPASSVLAAEKNANLTLLVRESSLPDVSKGVFVVRQDSEIESIGQLKGRRLAFGSKYSAAGRYSSQRYLLEAGIKGSDLAEYRYLGRHDRVAYAVAAGTYDAGVLRSEVFERLAKAKKLRVIAEFLLPEKIWIAREGLEPDLLVRIQSVLGGQIDQVVRWPNNWPKLVPLTDGYLDTVKRDMKIAKGFDQKS